VSVIYGLIKGPGEREALVEGGRRLCGLNGRYQAITYDVHTHELSLANDLLGIQPFFYSRSRDWVAIGARSFPFRFIRGFVHALDPEGALDLLQLGHQLGDRTLETNVHRVPPGSVVEFSSGGSPAVHTVARIEFSEANWSTPLDAIAAEMEARLLDSIRLAASKIGSPVVPLSGGMDSRVVVGLLKRLGIPCVTASFGDPDNLDSKIARRVSDLVGLRHQDISRSPDPAAQLLRHFAITEGAQDAVASYWMDLVDAFAEAGSSIVPGVLGSWASGQNIPSPHEMKRASGAVFETKFQSLVEKEGGFSDAILDRYLEPEVLRVARGSTRERSREVFESNGAETYQRLFAWDAATRQRIFIATDLRIADRAGLVLDPFSDRVLIDFLASLPYSALSDRRAYKLLLERLVPSVSHVAFSDGGKALRPTRGERAWVLRAAPERLLPRIPRRMIGRLRLLGLGSRDWWSSVYGSRPEVDRILRESLGALRGILRDDRLDEVEHLGPGQRRKLTTLAIWAKTFG